MKPSGAARIRSNSSARRCATTAPSSWCSKRNCAAALERNEIEVLYQPIARLADMELAGFEALVRWRHKTLGLLAPEHFIGLAETTGIIKDIGRHVLNEAGRQLGIWQRAFRPA